MFKASPQVAYDLFSNDLGMFCFFIGYECDPGNNPADFLLDVINGDSTAVALNNIDDICTGTQHLVPLHHCYLV